MSDPDQFKNKEFNPMELYIGATYNASVNINVERILNITNRRNDKDVKDLIMKDKINDNMLVDHHIQEYLINNCDY